MDEAKIKLKLDIGEVKDNASKAEAVIKRIGGAAASAAGKVKSAMSGVAGSIKDEFITSFDQIRGEIELSKDLKKQQQSLEILTSQLKSFEAAGKDTSKILERINQVKSGKVGIEELTMRLETLKNQSSAVNSVRKSFNNMKNAADKAGGALKNYVNKLKQSKKATESHSFSMKKAINTLIRYGLGIRGIFALYRKVRQAAAEAFKSMAGSNAEFNNTMSNLMNSFNQAKNSLGTALQPLVSAIAPILARICEMFTNAMNVVGQFFALLTGQKYILKAAKANDTYATSADNVAKSQDKANKALGNYDELNVIDKGSDSSSGSSSSGGGFTQEAVDSSAFGWLDTVKAKFEPVIAAVGRLKDALEPLKAFGAQALTDFYNNFLVPVGNWTLGVGIPRLIDGLTTLTNSIDWGKLNGALADLWDSLAPFAITVGEGLLWLYENVLIPLAAWTISDVLPAFLEILSGALDVLTAVTKELSPVWQGFWDKVLKPIASWTGGVIVDVMEGLGNALKWIADNEIAVTILESLAIAIGLVVTALTLYNAVGAITTAVTTGLAAVVGFLTSPITIVIAAITALVAIGITLYKNWETIKEGAAALWEAITGFFSDLGETISQNLEEIGEHFSAAWDNICGIFSNIGQFFRDRVADIKNAFSSIGSFFKDTFDNAIKGIKDVFSSIGNFFSDVASKVKKPFENIANWFKDIFTKAWTNVKNVFSSGGKIFDGIKDGILNGFKTVVNGIIGGINKVISIPFDGINSALQRIHDVNILGVEPFTWIKTISVPQIPKLAQGAVIPPNKEFMAILGDQKSGTNIETPLDTMIEAFNVALDSRGGAGHDPIVLQVGQRTLAELVWDEQRKYYKQTGKLSPVY